MLCLFLSLTIVGVCVIVWLVLFAVFVVVLLFFDYCWRVCDRLARVVFVFVVVLLFFIIVGGSDR